ncbi:glycosyltransferase, partial [Acinetobacter baumannii]
GSSFYGFRADLIRSLLKNGHQVYAFTSEYTENCLEKIKALGAEPVTYQLSRGGLNPFADIASTYELIRKIKKIKPDIVFSYFAKPV